jgi:hypothetical protein
LKINSFLKRVFRKTECGLSNSKWKLLSHRDCEEFLYSFQVGDWSLMSGISSDDLHNFIASSVGELKGYHPSAQVQDAVDAFGKSTASVSVERDGTFVCSCSQPNCFHISSLLANPRGCLALRKRGKGSPQQVERYKELLGAKVSSKDTLNKRSC